MALKPPMFGDPSLSANEAQQYLHRARLFQKAAARLVDYTDGGQNWPRYALLLHASELALKAFIKQREMEGTVIPKQPANHDLQGWWALALTHGLPDDPSVAEHIATLSTIHFNHLTRYPTGRVVPDISVVADETVEYLITALTPIVNPR